jgi:hypothetical protein
MQPLRCASSAAGHTQQGSVKAEATARNWILYRVESGRSGDVFDRSNEAEPANAT